MDYAWGGAAIPLSYTIELSPSFYFDEFPDNNFFLGFLYPEEKLADTVEATWQGFKAMARAVDCLTEVMHVYFLFRPERAWRVVLDAGFLRMTNVLATVTKQAKDADVTLSSMGRSFEGRDMPFVEIREKDGDRKRETKPAIVIDAGIHAREWIAPAMALNIINKVIIIIIIVIIVIVIVGVVIIICVVNIVTIIITARNVHNSDRRASETQNIRDWLDDLSDRAVMFVTMHAFVSTLRSSRTTIFALGFLYPEEKLPDTVDATWNGFKAMARAIYDEAAEDDEEEDRRDV
nr:hypothetical protein BaRGS_024127 [Batillaria attramentaria]